MLDSILGTESALCGPEKNKSHEYAIGGESKVFGCIRRCVHML